MVKKWRHKCLWNYSKRHQVEEAGRRCCSQLLLHHVGIYRYEFPGLTICALMSIALTDNILILSLLYSEIL